MGALVCKSYAYEHEIVFLFVVGIAVSTHVTVPYRIVSGWHSDTHGPCTARTITIDHCRRRQSFGRVDIASVRGCHPTSNQLSARHTPLPQPRSRSIAAKRLPTQRFAHGANRVTRMRGLVRCIRAACPVCAIVRVSGWPTAPQAGTGITSAIAVVRPHPSVSFRRGLGGTGKP